MKKEQSNNDQEQKTAFEVLCECQSILSELDNLPELIQLLIDNYHLEKLYLSDAQKIDLVNGHHTIYSVLAIVQSQLTTMNEKITTISLEKNGRE